MNIFLIYQSDQSKESNKNDKENESISNQNHKLDNITKDLKRNIYLIPINSILIDITNQNITNNT